MSEEAGWGDGMGQSPDEIGGGEETVAFEPPRASATPFPVADIQAPHELGRVEYQSIPILRPEEDLKEVKIVVRASLLRRCRNKLSSVIKTPFPWYEIALAASAMSGGAVIGAIPADIKPKTLDYFIFFSVLPAIALALFITYLFVRHMQRSEVANVAADVLGELPDPDKAA